LLAHGQWFSPGTPASSTAKTGRHDIAAILLKVTLDTKNQIKSPSFINTCNICIPMINNKIKNKTYHAVGTIPKSNIKITDRGKTDNPNT
jgi:hypothetical protein